MSNRLAELKSGLNVDEIAIEIQDRRKAPTSTPAGSAAMQDFYRAVEVIKGLINDMMAASRTITDINQELVLATTEEKEERSSEFLEQTIRRGNKNAKDAQGLLKDLNAEVKEAVSVHELPSPDLRIRKNLVLTLTKKYMEVLKDYQNAQNKCKELRKKRAVKRVLQVKPTATAEEIEAVLQSGGAGKIMAQAILGGEAADVVRNAYENVSSKYQDVLRLEASVVELAAMFQDLALVVEQQAELVDQIEYHVKHASECVTYGNLDLEKSLELQKEIRRKQCCIVSFIAIISLLVVGIVLAVVAAQGGFSNK